MSDTRILCEASEKGKIVANKCLDCGYNITTLKLEKLLILMHGAMLSKYQKPFFRQNVIALEHGPVIREVDQQLIMYALGFKERMREYICLLSKEEEIMDEIIQTYGMLDAFELNARKELKVLSELCYEEGTPNIVPNELIEKVFDYYKFYDVDTVRRKEDSFQRKLKMQFNGNKK